MVALATLTFPVFGFPLKTANYPLRIGVNTSIYQNPVLRRSFEILCLYSGLATLKGGSGNSSDS